MKISVIIPTYNRYHTLNQLISQLDKIEEIDEIIVIDSTNVQDRQIIYHSIKLRYFCTLHQNGLFQRYAGSIAAKNDWLLFFDNDMEIINKRFIEVIKQYIWLPKISGIAFRIVDKHQDTALAAIPESITKGIHGGVKKWVNRFTGYPPLQPGKLGLCGNRGKQPKDGEVTEWLSGGAFLARKELLFRHFNFQQFGLFEEKMGMGEDALFGYGLSRQGDLIYSDEILFYHNDQKDSAYSAQWYNYAKRVMYSRIFLSLEKLRLDRKPLVTGYLHYHWYCFWRILGLFMNMCIHYSSARKSMFKGSLAGWFNSFSFSFRYTNQDKQQWYQEAVHTINAR